MPGAPWLVATLTPRLPHHITAGELVVEGVESPCWILLGTAVEHTLEGLEITDAFIGAGRLN